MTITVAAISSYSSNATYTLTSGTLPPGLSLSNSGGISGTLSTSANGVYTFGVGAIDAYANVGVVRNFTMNTTSRNVVWNLSSNLGSYVQETLVTIPLVATSSISGSTITYSITTGSLPSGLSIVSNTITGILPSNNSNSTYSFTITATDSIASNALVMTLSSVANSNSDLYAGNVVCLLHFDNGSFADVLGHQPAMFGSPNITSNGVGLYNSSLYLNGSSYLSYSQINNDLQFGSGDFTIECSVYFLASPTSSAIIGQWMTSGQYAWAMDTAVGGSNYLQFNFSSSGTGYTQYINAPYTFVINTWYRLACSRVGSTAYLFVNGVLVGTTSLSGVTLTASTDPIQIGAPQYITTMLTGFVDEVRITKGYGRYTGVTVGATYYTPILPFPNPPIISTPASNAVAIMGGGAFTLNAITSYGAQPLTYSLVSGTLPSGLTMSNTIGVTGTVTNPGSITNYTFVMNATDSHITISKTIVAEVIPGVNPVWVTPSGNLGAQVQGTNFYYQLNAVSNAIILTTSAATSAAGNVLTFGSTTGVMFGMTIQGALIPANTTVSALTSTTVTTSQIIPPVPSGAVFNFTPSPVSYTVTTGALPNGLSLSSSGVISGMLGWVSANTTTNFTVTAAVSTTLNASQSFSITTQTTAVVDPYVANVVLDMHFTGTTGSKIFWDQGGHVTNVISGNVAISTVTSIAGGSSVYFPSTGYNYIVLNQSPQASSFTFGSNSFTIEYSFNTTSTASTYQWIIQGFGTTTYGSICSWGMFLTNGSSLTFRSNGNSDITYSYSFSANAWYTVALVATGTTLVLYINGTEVSSGTISSAIKSTTGICFGADFSASSGAPTSNLFAGYLDEVRVTTGAARYSGSTYTLSQFPLVSACFLTPAGSLGTQVQSSNFGVYVIAQSQFENPVIYSISSGALPTGLTIDAATGYIGGTLPTVVSNTVSNFTVGAYDGTGTTLQSFSITTAANAIVDTVSSLVVAKMHFDGVHGSTNFLDAIGHPVQTSTTSVPVINNVYRQFGSGSMFLDGVASFIYIGNTAITYSEFTFGSKDFTVEMSVYFTNIPTTICLVEQNSGFGVAFNGNKLYFYASCPGGSSPSGSNYYTWTPVINTWYQLAFVCANGVFTIYANGTALSLTGSSSLSIGSTYAGYPIEIGRYNPSSSVYGSAYFDELRITIGSVGSGAARYTANYVPSVQPFP